MNCYVRDQVLSATRDLLLLNAEQEEDEVLKELEVGSRGTFSSSLMSLSSLGASPCLPVALNLVNSSPREAWEHSCLLPSKGLLLMLGSLRSLCSYPSTGHKIVNLAS